MASKVPKFGSWEAGENYTAYFDTARKTKSTGPMINPNDPEQNPAMFPQNRPPRGVESQGQQSKVPEFGAWDGEDGDGYTAYFETASKTRSNRPLKIDKEPQLNRDMNHHGEPPACTDPDEPQTKVPQKTSIVTEGTSDATPSNDHVGQEGRSKAPQFGAWDGKEAVKYTAYFDNPRKNRAEPVEPQLNRDVGERPRPTKVRSEENMDHGGMKSNYDQRSSKDDGQLRNVSRGSTSTGSEKQGRQTPVGQSPLHSRGKPQTKPGGRGSQTPERGTTIPPFGVWHKDPAQAEGFTGPMIRSREDRLTPLNNTTPARHNTQSTQNPNKKSKKKWWCFCC